MTKKDKSQTRYSRTRVSATCLMLHQGRSYMMDVQNISASGILLKVMDENEQVHLHVGSHCVLEIVVNDTFNLHVEAEVIRIDGLLFAFSYTQIPEEKQDALWQLLGKHVHMIEKF